MAYQEDLIRTSRLPNGVLVLTEEMPDVESASFGIWADAGSADEGADEHGVAHFLEHMLFKGTEHRSAYELAVAIEDIGGVVDAYTERELTHVGARVLTEQLPVAIELLADMICHSSYSPDEMTRERQVIIEEIRKYQGLPEERIHDLAMEGLWQYGALGHPILGDEASVRALTRERLLACWQRHFASERVLITAAGKLEHDQVVALVADAFAALPTGMPALPRADEGTCSPVLVIEEDCEQVNMSWGIRSFPSSDDRIFALALVDLILGGSSTSRLFQEIREKRGLAYDISSYLMAFRDTGLLAVSAATGPETFPQVVRLIRDEIQRLRVDGVTPHEWARAITQLKSGMALGLEGSADRMRRLAMHQLTWGQVYPLGMLMARIDQVTIDDLRTVMAALFDLEQWAFTAIGPLTCEEVSALVLEHA